MAGILDYDVSPWNYPNNPQQQPIPLSQSALGRLFNFITNPGGVQSNGATKGNMLPPAASFADRFGNLPPNIVGPNSSMQPPPSSQPGRGNGAGAPLNILAGADMSGNASLPANAMPTQGMAPPPFANPFSIGPGLGGIPDRLARALSIMNPQAGQVYYGRQLQQAQFNALMQDPNMTPGRAIAMMQSPQILQNYYDTRQLGTVKNAAGEEMPVIASQGQVGPLATSGSSGDFMSGGMDKIKQKAAATAAGTAQGTQQASLPNRQALFDESLKNIDTILADPNLSKATGIYGKMYAHIPGSAAQGIAAKLQQLQGESSINGLQYLMGLNRININEFNAVTNAMKAMKLDPNGMSDLNVGDLRKALLSLRQGFAMARERAGVTAGVGPTPSPYAQQGPVDLGGGWSVQQR